MIDDEQFEIELEGDFGFVEPHGALRQSLDGGFMIWILIIKTAIYLERADDIASSFEFFRGLNFTHGG